MIEMHCPFCGNLCHGWSECSDGVPYRESAECSDCGAFQNFCPGEQHPYEDRPLDAEEKRNGWARGDAATCKRPRYWEFEEDWFTLEVAYAFDEGMAEAAQEDGQPVCECPNCQALRWLARLEILHCDGPTPTVPELVECFLTRLRLGDQTELLK